MMSFGLRVCETVSECLQKKKFAGHWDGEGSAVRRLGIHVLRFRCHRSPPTVKRIITKLNFTAKNEEVCNVPSLVFS